MNSPDDLLDVSAIVVNYNAGSILTSAVESLLVCGSREVIVVDNDSSDDSINHCQQTIAPSAGHRVKFLQTGSNLGYGRAANFGATSALGEFVAICNSDCIAAPDALKLLIEFLSKHRDVGILGPQIVDEYCNRYPSPRRFPSLWVSGVHATLGVIFPNNRISRYYRSVDSEVPNKAMWISGAFFIMTRELFQRLGGFDEGYFMYLEDVDLCQRVIQASYKVGFLASSKVEHHQGTSSRSRPYFAAKAHHRSLWRYSRKNLTGIRQVLLPLVAVGIAMRFLLTSSKIWVKSLRIGSR